MYTLIIFAVIFILMTVAHLRNGTANSIEIIENLFLSIFISALLYGLVIAAGRQVLKSENIEITYEDLHIVSLGLSKDYKMHGSFILGTGSINGETVESYITYGNFKSGLKRIKIDAYSTYINETNSTTPRIKNYYRRESFKAFKSKWFWNKERVVYLYNYEDDYDVNRPSLVLVVPEHTIYKEFSIKE